MEVKTFLIVLNSLVMSLIFEEIKCLSNCDKDPLVTYDAYLPNNVTKVIQPFGRKMCIEECKKTKVCQSANHWKQTMECQLNNDIKSASNQLTNGEGWTYIQIEKPHNTCNGKICSEREICTPLKNGGYACVVHRCDSIMTIGNNNYTVNNTSIGAYTENPCSHNIAVTCTYNCKAHGNWVQIECNSTLTIGNNQYTMTNTQVGAYTNKPCVNNVDYISVGCTYTCNKTGDWELTANKGWIKVYYVGKTWFQANTTCTADNAHLLVIPNATYLTDVSNVVNPIISGQSLSVTCGTVTNIFWAGSNDLEVEGTFKWVNGDSYTSWHNSKQTRDNKSCDGATQADCTLFSTGGGGWNDRNCLALLPFICQKP